MYGLIPKANSVALESEPPESAAIMFRNDCPFIASPNVFTSMPGTGM